MVSSTAFACILASAAFARAAGEPSAAPVAAAPGLLPSSPVVATPAIRSTYYGAMPSSPPRVALAVTSAADAATVAALRHVLEQLGVEVVLAPLPDAKPGATVVASSPLAGAVERVPATAGSPLVWEGQLRYRYETRTLLDYRLPGTFGRAGTQVLGERGDLSIMRTRVGASLKLAPGVRGMFSLQDARTMGAEGSPGGTLANVDLYNAYVDLDSLGEKPLALRVGRQVLSYGDGRVVSGADWGNAGRAYDGARARWATKRTQSDAFVSWISEGRVGGADRVLSGFDVLLKPAKGIEAEGYHFRRHFGDAGWTNEAGTKGGLYDATSGMRARVVRGSVDARVEGAVQRGTRANDDVSAWFGVGRVTVDLHSAWKSKLTFEHMRASGDRVPNDGKFERFDPVYWGGHGYQGALDIAGESNLADWCAGVVSQPVGAWTVQAELHSFSLMQARDYWVDDAGTTLRRNTGGTAGRRLGHELDASVKWDARSKASVLAGASRFWAGPFVRDTGGGADLVWGYLQLTVAF